MNSLPPLKYLYDCSNASLHAFAEQQMERAAGFRREIREALRTPLEDWVEARALCLLAEWLMEYGAEMISGAEPGKENNDLNEGGELCMISPQKRTECGPAPDKERRSSFRVANHLLAKTD